MSPYKTMKGRDYEKWIRQYAYSLQKTSTDWRLVNSAGVTAIRNIIVTHPGNEVIADSVKKTKTHFIEKGLE